MPPDFFWGAMKSAVYKDNPHSLCDLKESITYFIRIISSNELMLVYKPMEATSNTYCKYIHYNLLPTGALGHFAHTVYIYTHKIPAGKTSS